jgi:hypothetical protein
MATLYARKGDPQALKVYAAAQLSGASISFSSVASIANVVSKGSNPFGTNSILLVTPSVQLSEPSAAAAYLGAFRSVRCRSTLPWLT